MIRCAVPPYCAWLEPRDGGTATDCTTVAALEVAVDRREDGADAAADQAKGDHGRDRHERQDEGVLDQSLPLLALAHHLHVHGNDIEHSVHLLPRIRMRSLRER